MAAWREQAAPAPLGSSLGLLLFLPCQVALCAPGQALLRKQQLCRKFKVIEIGALKRTWKKLQEDFVLLNLPERGSSSMSHPQL